LSSSRLEKAGTGAVNAKGLRSVMVLYTPPLNRLRSFSGERKPREFSFMPAHTSSKLSLLGIREGSGLKVGESMAFSLSLGMESGVGRMRFTILEGYWECWMAFLLAWRSIKL
jgi:hypothetical protein